MSGYERRIGHSVLAAVVRAAHPDTYSELRGGKRHRHLRRWRGVLLIIAVEAILRVGRWRGLCHEWKDVGHVHDRAMPKRHRSDWAE
jgi:hypothetical protein